MIGLALGTLTTAEVPLPRPAVIPQPQQIAIGPGGFVFGPDTIIAYHPQIEGSETVAQYLQAVLSPATGFELPIKRIQGMRRLPTKAVVMLPGGTQEALGDEGYQMKVDTRRVLIEAQTAAGLFYGTQTLRQLLPPEVFANTKQTGPEWMVPASRIVDKPSYAWRGLMLDVGRHYMPVEFVKKTIDLLALHKMNVLHWHLTEDQGWRLEIKKYPRLTEVGSVRRESPVKGNRKEGDGTPYGPFFYTQEEVREIVAYAAERHVTVVPEIEMPGHALGALVAYPELSCTGGPFEVRTRWGIEDDIYCAGKEEVFQFVEDVLTEVLDLFPSTFIHIGGDEAPKARWKECPRCQARMKAEGLKDEHELQSYFIRRIDKFLTEKGRRLIGWDEILEGGLASGAAVMSWRGIGGGVAAANAGHDVVMTPTTHCYLDYAQARGSDEPEAIGGYLPLSVVYSYEPTPSQLSPAQHQYVVGVQGNLWTEYMHTPEEVEYFGFPRACALAEIGWTPSQLKDYASFRERLVTHLKRLDQMQVNYRRLTPEPQVVARWTPGDAGEEWHEREWDITSAVREPGDYRVTFMFTHGTHRFDIEGVAMEVNGTPVGRDDHSGSSGARHRNNAYSFDVAQVIPGGRYTLRARVRTDGGFDSNGEIYVETVK
ncbi:beta-N-acetylhexosaminidase [bacterium]|nr:beta-N-acetylhexosaminidase [bacterium]